MLKDLRIENFRLFKEFKIDDLARVNLIVGKNNVGKSTLLEAIQLLVSEGSPQVLFEQFEARGEIYLDKESLRHRGGYNISHLFSGHELEDGVSLQLAGSGISDLLLQVTFVRDLEKFPVEDDERKIIDSSYLKFKYGTTKIRERTISAFGELIDRRQS